MSTNNTQKASSDSSQRVPIPTMDSVQLKLARAQNTKAEIDSAGQAAGMFNQFAIITNYRALSRLLIQQKELPPVYFRNAAEDSGIDKDIFRKWNPNRWPNQAIKSPERLQEITQTLIRVWLYVWPYPAAETYWQAQERLVQLTESLVRDHGISLNQIANYLLMQHSTLTDILAKTRNGRLQPKHCPWNLIDRLSVPPEEITKASSAPRKSLFTMHTTGNRDYRQEIADRRKVIETLKSQLIADGDDCPKCGAPWNNIRYIGRHEEFHTLKEHSCIPCGKTIFTGQIIPVMIHRHGPCEHCAAPRNNLSKAGQDRLGRTRMLCKACNEYSLRPAPESATKD